MLRSLKEVFGYRLNAQDGEIGKVKDFYFDDERWTIRYLIADTGKWLPGRSVLIAPASFEGRPDWNTRRFPLSLTREQIKSCPPIDSRKPVSRQKEIELANFYRWPLYWQTEPNEVFLPTAGTVVMKSSDANGKASDTHLRSAKEVRGYAAEASDGTIGRVTDFIVQDETWAIRYLVIDTKPWIPGRQVLLSPKWLDGIDWLGKSVRIDKSRSEIKKSPAFNPSKPVNKQYEEKLLDYYGRPNVPHDTSGRPPSTRLKKIMTQELEITRPDATLEEASKRMETGDVGVLPVLDDARLIGVITDRDIVVRALSRGKDPKRTKVRDVMSPDIVTCSMDSSVQEAGKIMERKKLRRLMVVDQKGNFRGVVSIGDLANKTKDQRFVGEVLEKISG